MRVDRCTNLDVRRQNPSTNRRDKLGNRCVRRKIPNCIGIYSVPLLKPVHQVGSKEGVVRHDCRIPVARCTSGATRQRKPSSPIPPIPSIRTKAHQSLCQIRLLEIGNSHHPSEARTSVGRSKCARSEIVGDTTTYESDIDSIGSFAFLKLSSAGTSVQPTFVQVNNHALNFDGPTRSNSGTIPARVYSQPSSPIEWIRATPLSCPRE